MSVATAGEGSDRAEIGVSDTRRVSRAFGLVVVLTAVLTSVASFLILTGQTAIEPTPAVVRAAVIVNGLIVLLLIGIVAYEALWSVGRAASGTRCRAASYPHRSPVLVHCGASGDPDGDHRVGDPEQGARPLVLRAH